MRQVGHEPACDGIGNPGEHHRDGACSIQCCRHHRICGSKDYIRRKAYNFLRHVAHPLLAFACKAVLETDVAAIYPAEVLQGFSEGCEIALPYFVILSEPIMTPTRLTPSLFWARAVSGQMAVPPSKMMKIRRRMGR